MCWTAIMEVPKKDIAKKIEAYERTKKE